MGIDPVGPKGPNIPSAPETKETSEVSETSETTESASATVESQTEIQSKESSSTNKTAFVQSLATEVKQGRLQYEEAIQRFAADVVTRRYPNLSGQMRQAATKQVGRTLAEDINFRSRFERLLAKTE